jgi:hypothetical protein
MVWTTEKIDPLVDLIMKEIKNVAFPYENLVPSAYILLKPRLAPNKAFRFHYQINRCAKLPVFPGVFPLRRNL